MSYQASLFGPARVEPIALRPYQQEGIDQARALFREGHKRILLVLPTGGGKTIVAASIMAGAIIKGNRALFVAPRREIISQSFWKLIDAGVPEHDTGVIMGNGCIVDRDGGSYPGHRPMARAFVASIQTLQNRRLPPADVVFWDEAHHCVSKTHDRVIRHYAEHGAAVVGLTATPVRTDGKGFRESFDVLHQIATIRRLIAEGWLAEPRVLGPELSFDDVKTGRDGDYQSEALAQAVNERVVIGDVLGHWQAENDGRTTVVFETSTARSKAMAEAFRAIGVRAEHIDSDTPTDQRDRVLRRLATGELQVVCNMGLLTEGWDLPRAKCGVIARPTKSLSLWLQMCGRFLRPWQGVQPVILDHGGNSRLHGRPQYEHQWSLDGVKRRAAIRAETVRACPKCHAPLDGGTAVCPACFYVFPVRAPKEPERVDGKLVEIREDHALEYRRGWYREVLREAMEKGRRVGWARHRYRERFATWPRFFRDEKEFFVKESA